MCRRCIPHLLNYTTDIKCTMMRWWDRDTSRSEEQEWAWAGGSHTGSWNALNLYQFLFPLVVFDGCRRFSVTIHHIFQFRWLRKTFHNHLKVVISGSQWLIQKVFPNHWLCRNLQFSLFSCNVAQIKLNTSFSICIFFIFLALHQLNCKTEEVNQVFKICSNCSMDSRLPG